MTKLHYIILFILAFPSIVIAQETSFREWLDTFYPVAKKAGIQYHTWQKAFAGINAPDMVVLERAAYQPEFKTEIWDYLDTRTNYLRANEGRKRGNAISNTLRTISKRFGVAPEILLAIWSIESNYGEILKETSRLHYVPQALATLAWKDRKRRKFAKNQLIAALKILQHGDIDRSHLTGSWAGAMGQTQFIPTSYLAYGFDMDRDGRRDIWNSIPDALATAANLLHKNGWKTGKPWGYEVILSTKRPIKPFIGQTKKLAQWQKLGFIRPDGSRFPLSSERAELKRPAGKGGPLLLCMKNFFVIKRYNNADAYALAVALLSDKIAGRKGILSPWPRPANSLNFSEKVELQKLLAAGGWYDGAVDGAIGPASRKSIERFQQENGLTITGKGDKKVLQQLQSFSLNENITR